MTSKNDTSENGGCINLNFWRIKMDFELTEGQKMVRDMCRQFASEVIAPRAEEVDIRQLSL